VAELPMFPLGTVLLPSVVIPLHVFEERYRALVRHCIDGDGRFGVVLIARGSEVGGGDQRTEVGTAARILEAARFDDGRYAIAAVGEQRIRVRSWLPDDPYPRAEVEPFDDPPPSAAAAADLADVLTRLRRWLARAAEAGASVAPATSEVSEDDVVLASYQAVALAPIGPADRQRLLATPTVDDRIAQLGAIVDDELEALDLLRRLDDD
jgi:Lon protease-like protein